MGLDFFPKGKKLKSLYIRDMPNQTKVGEEREIWGKRKRKLWEIGPINVKNVKNQSCGDFEKLTVDAKKNFVARAVRPWSRFVKV